MVGSSVLHYGALFFYDLETYVVQKQYIYIHVELSRAASHRPVWIHRKSEFDVRVKGSFCSVWVDNYTIAQLVEHR